MSTIENNNKISGLIFKCDDLLFATPVLSIKEILPAQKCHAMSGLVEGFLGVFNNRGLIVGVIDFAARMKTGNSDRERKIFITFDTNQGVLAIAIDEVMEIEDLLVHDHSNYFHSGQDGERISGVAESSHGLVNLVNITSLMNLQELETFRKNSIAPFDVFEFNVKENLAVLERLRDAQDLKIGRIEFKQSDFSIKPKDVYTEMLDMYKSLTKKFRLKPIQNRVKDTINPADVFQLSFDINKKLTDKWNKQELSPKSKIICDQYIEQKTEKQEDFAPGDVMQVVFYMKQIAEQLKKQEVKYKFNKQNK